jgi:hypothetical protein
MKIGLFGPCYQILAAALEALLSIRTQNASYRYGFKSVPWFSDGRFFEFKVARVKPNVFRIQTKCVLFCARYCTPNAAHGASRFTN